MNSYDDTNQTNLNDAQDTSEKTQDRARKFIAEWERRALLELYNEYAYVIRERRLNIKLAALELYDSNTHWGLWDAQTRTIRLSRKLLITYPWFQVVGVLKHEIAHQLVDETYGRDAVQGDIHGKLFKEACKRLGLPNEFSKSSVNLQKQGLDWREEKTDEASERMLEKVRKLLALATSSNEYEALSAMKRVREIYARHNIEQADAQVESNYAHLVITRNSKRLETYEKKIISILVGHFFVQVIAGQTYDASVGEKHRSIEIIGTRESVLMAEYVYHFLLQQSEYLVDQASKQSSQKFSRVTRKSYRLGILTGFAEKLSLQEKEIIYGVKEENVISKALVKFENDTGLDDYVSKVYPRLRTLSTGRQRLDRSAYSQGQIVGRQITLNKPISNSSGNQGRFIGTSKK